MFGSKGAWVLVGCFGLLGCSRAKSEESTPAPVAIPASTPAPPPPPPPPQPVPASPVLPPPNLPPLSSGIHLTVSAEVTPGGIVLKGETNLPDGTQLFPKVESPGDFEAWAEVPSQVPTNQISTLVVNGGRFASAPFPAAEGNYVPRISMFNQDTQPASVQEALKVLPTLVGPAVHVEDGDTSVYADGAELIVGAEPEKTKAAAIASRKQAKRQLEAFVKELTAMERRSRTAAKGLDAGSACTERLVREHARLNEISAVVDKLPLPWPAVGLLRSATVYAKSCSDCRPQDTMWCDELSAELKEASGELAASVVK